MVVYIPPENSLYSDIDLFFEIESYVIVSLELFSVNFIFDVLPYDPIFSDVYKPIFLQMYVTNDANSVSDFMDSMCIGGTYNDLSEQK